MMAGSIFSWWGGQDKSEALSLQGGGELVLEERTRCRRVGAWSDHVITPIVVEEIL